MMTAEELGNVVNAELRGEDVEFAWASGEQKEWNKKNHKGWYPEDCVYRIKQEVVTKWVVVCRTDDGSYSIVAECSSQWNANEIGLILPEGTSYGVARVEYTK